MGAVVEEFAQVIAPAPSVYVDANVILAAYSSTLPNPRPKDIASAGFIELLAQAGSEAWTSLLAVQEACWVPLREELTQSSKQAGCGTDWKRLRRRDPTAFSAAYQAARARADPVMQFIRDLPLAVRWPRHPGTATHRACRAICYLARKLLSAYELEAADAFHIAMAMVDGTRHVASLDGAFQDVDQITVYAHRKL